MGTLEHLLHVEESGICLSKSPERAASRQASSSRCHVEPELTIVMRFVHSSVVGSKS